MKKVPVYFYYLNVLRPGNREDGSVYRFSDFITFFSEMLGSLAGKELLGRKYDFKSDEKVIWLDSCEDLGNGNYNLVFKSAKYNHVRHVIDTAVMLERGTIKQRTDGDEERTHLCIRYHVGQERLICIHESNYYGMAIGRIIRYLNEKLEQHRTEIDGKYTYILQKEIMPCDDFLEELRKMRYVSLLKVTIERQDLQDDFLRLSDRDDIKDTIDISIGKIKRNKYIPKNMVREYYTDMQNENKIKRIVAEGANQSGSFRLDTELIKMKQSITVDTSSVTNEVDSTQFFIKAQELINEMR